MGPQTQLISEVVQNFVGKKVENGVDGLMISGKDRHWNKRAESIIKEFSSKMELVGPKKCEERPT